MAIAAICCYVYLNGRTHLFCLSPFIAASSIMVIRQSAWSLLAPRPRASTVLKFGGVVFCRLFPAELEKKLRAGF